MTTDIFAGQGYRRFERVDDTARHALHGLMVREIARIRDQLADGSNLREILNREIENRVRERFA